SRKHPLLGQDAWCGFSFLLPEEFPIVDVRLVLSQWKQSGLAGSPLVAQRYVDGRHYLTIRDLDTRGEWREVVELPDIVPERWNDMLFHVRFSAGSDGLVEVWMNGRRVARVAGPTASPEGEPRFYHKVGLYRDRMAAPMTVYLDDYALGPRREDVDPARDGGR
ncbi:MAG: heparin lyase I family protein, partial [Planctomycetota bacterium JB042]